MSTQKFRAISCRTIFFIITRKTKRLKKGGKSKVESIQKLNSIDK